MQPKPEDSFRRTLLLAKRLLQHAVGHALRGTIPDRMIAIHDTHSAVEWLLVAVHDWLKPGTTLPDKFEALFKATSDALQAAKGIPLTLKGDMLRLARGRNDAQHRADPPSTEELQAHYARAESFFAETLDALGLGITFENLSLADLLASSFTITRKLYDPIYDEQGNLHDAQQFDEEISVPDQFRDAESLARNHPATALQLLQELVESVEDEVSRVMVTQVPQSVRVGEGRNRGGLSGLSSLLALGAAFDNLFPLEPTVGAPATREGALRHFYEGTSAVLLRLSAGADLSEYQQFEWLCYRAQILHEEPAGSEVRWALNFTVDVLLKYQPILTQTRPIRSRGLL